MSKTVKYNPIYYHVYPGKGIMNPNFGILKNGTIITGYLTEDHVTSLEWINLVQGIIWLVRDGKVI